MPANKKPAMSWEDNREVTRALDQLSKAALLDCVVDLLREHGPSVDDPVTEEIARKRLECVILLRGDTWPKQRRIQKVQA